MFDRAYLSRCLAKATAYLACGKLMQAEDWAQRLVDSLREAGLNIR